MTEFNREMDPWKRIERNINIRAEQAKYEIFRAATLYKWLIYNRERMQSEYLLKHLFAESILAKRFKEQHGDNVLDLTKYRNDIESAKASNIKIKTIKNLDTFPYQSWYIPSKLTFPKQEWVYNLEKPDDKDPK